MKTIARTFAALTVAGFLAVAIADTTPSEGTIGTEFTATFEGDVGSKPKIELTYFEPTKKAKTPKAKAKVTSVNGGEVKFVIQAAKGGGFFQVGVKGSDENGGTIQLVPPRVDSADKETVAAGGELVLTGQYFGEDDNKRNAPKVFVNGKKAKTLSFSDGSLTIQVHRGTSAGLANISVENKIGAGSFDGQVTITAPPKPIKGPDSIQAKIGGKTFKSKFSKKSPQAAVAVFNAPVGVLQITGATNKGSPRNLTTTIFTINVDIGVNSFDDLVLPATFNDVGLVTHTINNVKASGGIPPQITTTSTMWTKEGAETGFSITIDGWDGERFSCSFGGTLTLKAGDGPGSIQVEGGSAILEPQQ